MTDLYHTVSNLRVHAISFSQGVISLLNLSDTEKLKYLEGSLTLSFQSIILSDYKWKGLGHSNVLFSTEETLQNADEAFDIRQRDHSYHEKQN